MRSLFVPLVVAMGLMVGLVQSGALRGVEPGPDVARRDPIPESKVTPECKRSIERGTEWLISVMRRDGSVGTDVGQRPDLACTAIVGLALLAEGSTPHGGPHATELRRLLNALLDMLERRPDVIGPSDQYTLIQRKIGRNADLFLAALFLTQIHGEAPGYEKDIRKALDHLVDLICQAQNQDGTWGDDSWAPVLGTVLGWESLRAASSCGMKIEASAQRAGEALLKRLREQGDDRNSWMHSFYKNASSVRVLYSLKYKDDPVFQRCLENIFRFAKEDYRPFQEAGGEEYLAFFFVTECLLKEQRDELWQSWYPTVSPKIIAVQNSDGSWSGHHCITARTFCTAAALLTLQSQNFYLPISDL